jgi:carbamate kinase
MTQGHLGSLVVLSLHRALRGRRPVAALVSHVTVDPRDPAFGAPSKPIGPFLSEGQAARAAAERGYAMVADSGRGHRRTVASPLPRHLLELESVRFLLDAGHVVVAAGGGGIPVRSTEDGWEGIDAVIDKDHAAAELAREVGAEALVLVTAVEAVMVDFGSESPRRLGRIDVTEAERHLVEGQFQAGSMGPKVSAATRFIRSGGRTAVITTAELAAATLRGTDDAGRLGTRIVSAASRREGAA